MDSDLLNEKIYYVGTEDYEDFWRYKYPFNRLTLAFQRKHYFSVLKYLEEGDIPNRTFFKYFIQATVSIVGTIEKEFKEGKDDLYRSIEYNCILAIKRYLEQLGYMNPGVLCAKFFNNEEQPMEVSFESTL